MLPVPHSSHRLVQAHLLGVSRLLEHSLSLSPDLIEILIAAESERDLGLCEQPSEYLLYALLAA
jgi:hypothetical protein